jgi:hypothetical protein
MEILLIISVLFLIFCGGGFYWYKQSRREVK